MKCANPRKAAAVFASVLKKIKPGPAEQDRNFKAAESLMDRLRGVVPPSVEIRLAGSLAKNTNLSSNNEFDIFMLFPRHYPHHEMTMLGLSYARRAFSGMRAEARYAEHPYLQVFHGSYHADIVPAYRIEEIGQKGSSVDRSSLHTDFVNSRLDSRGKDDVRLLKQFMKNFGIYGAELRVEGFSGYLCELLIIRHGSLLALLEAASDWKENPVIEIEGHTAAKFEARLVVIDPVDPGRNVAAVVAQTSLSRFMFESRRFANAPSEKLFFSKRQVRTPREIMAAMKSRWTLCACVAFAAPKVVPDVLWPQLKKTSQAIARQLSEEDFSVFGAYHWSDGKTCAMLFELDRWELPKVRKAIGPKVAFGREAEKFVASHKNALNIHLEHGRIVAVEKRAHTSALESLKAALGKNSGVPAHMAGPLARGKILTGSALLRKEFLPFLSDYFFAKIA